MIPFNLPRRYYEIEPAEPVGWTLWLWEGDTARNVDYDADPDDEADRAEAYDYAQAEGEAWVASR